MANCQMSRFDEYNTELQSAIEGRTFNATSGQESQDGQILFEVYIYLQKGCIIVSRVVSSYVAVAVLCAFSGYNNL